MDAGLFQYRGGVRSLGKRKLADGKEYELFYRARTPAELSQMVGQLGNLDKNQDEEKKLIAVHKFDSKFIAESMCNEDGTPLLTIEQAELVPSTLKRELRDLIVVGSNQLGEDVGKD